MEFKLCGRWGFIFSLVLWQGWKHKDSKTWNQQRLNLWCLWLFHQVSYFEIYLDKIRDLLDGKFCVSSVTDWIHPELGGTVTLFRKELNLNCRILQLQSSDVSPVQSTSFVMNQSWGFHSLQGRAGPPWPWLFFKENCLKLKKKSFKNAGSVSEWSPASVRQFGGEGFDSFTVLHFTSACCVN